MSYIYLEEDSLLGVEKEEDNLTGSSFSVINVISFLPRIFLLLYDACVYRYLLLLLQMVCCSFASILSLFLLLNHSSAILLLREIWWMCRKWKSEEEENRFTRPPIVRLDALISNHAPDSLSNWPVHRPPQTTNWLDPFFFTSYSRTDAVRFRNT